MAKTKREPVMAAQPTYLVSPVSGDSDTVVVFYLNTKRAVTLMRLRSLIEKTIPDVGRIIGETGDNSEIGITVPCPVDWCERFTSPAQNEADPETDQWYPVSNGALSKWVDLKAGPDMGASAYIYVYEHGVSLEIFYGGDDSFHTKEITWDELLQFMVDHGD